MDAAADEEPQTASLTLESLTPEEKRCDLYITAVHELNRRRERWGTKRLHRIATDLGLDPDQLTLTWCLLQGLEHTRQRSLAVRPGVEKSYLQVLHGNGHRAQVSHDSIPKADVREATEALLAAGQRVAEMRVRVEQLLNGRELELSFREEGEYEDDVSLSSDEEDTSPLSGCCTKAVKQLSNAENLPGQEIADIATRLATFAERVKEGDRSNVSEDLLRVTKHRAEALRWLSVTDNHRKTAKRRLRMMEAIESIGKEAGVRLHPVAKRALVDAFVDEESLAEGGLHAFRSLIPACVAGVVRRREMKRLLNMMKDPDHAIAEKLIERFGSARRCLRADISAIRESFGERDCEDVMRRIHGFDEQLFEVLRGHVVNAWLVARVLRDKFGGLLEARQAGFGKFFDGGEVVEISMDERLCAYQAIHEESFGSDRERYEASWGIFRAVCRTTKREDCVGMARWLIEELQSAGNGDVWSLCAGLGVDSEEAERLRMCVTNAGMTSGAQYLS